MTEADWLTTTDVPTLLRWAVPRGTRRQLRLYLCGGCRAIWHLLYDPASHEAIEVAERRADGRVSEREVFEAGYWAETPTFGYDFDEEWHQRNDPEGRITTVERLVACGALPPAFQWGDEWRIDGSVRGRLMDAANMAEAAIRANCDPASDTRDWWWLPHLNIEGWPGRWLVDCIYGNPFRPVSIRPEWRTPTALAIADGIYSERAFDRLPVLADALEDAGCDHPELLAHCRGPGPHVRGCWAVDRVLDKPNEPAPPQPAG